MIAFKLWSKKTGFWVFFMLLVFCGSAYSQSARAKIDYFQLPFYQIKDSRVEKSQEIEKDAKTEASDVFSIDTDPDGCVLWIDGRRVIGNPLTVARLPAGTYSYRVERNNYKSFYGTIQIRNGYRYLYEVTMEPERAYLSVDANQKIDQVLVNGKEAETIIGSDYYEIRPGSNSVTIRSFAFVDQSVAFYVAEDHLASLYVDLEAAPFAARLVSPSRSRFRPENLGKLGTTNLRFEVDAPGSAELLLFGKDGLVAWTAKSSDFKTWLQEIEWDGKDSQGLRLDDGDYRYRLVLQPGPSVSGAEVILNGSVSIDSSSFLKHRSQNGLFSGSTQVNDSHVLAANAIQAAFGLMLMPLGEELNDSLSTSLSASMRLGTGDNIEVSAGLMLETASDQNQNDLGGSEPDIMIGSNLKWAYAPARLAQVFSGSLQFFMAYLIDQDKVLPFGSEIFSRTPGFKLSNTIQFEYEHFFATLELGIYLGPYRSIARQIDWNAGLSAGLSLGLDLDWLYLAVQASLQSRAFDQWASLGLLDQGLRLGINTGLADQSGLNVFVGAGAIWDAQLMAQENSAQWRPFIELSLGFLN